MLDSLSDIERT